MKRADFIRSIEDSADRISPDFPNDPGMRARSFIAYLSGCLDAQGEKASARVLMALLAGDPKPSDQARKG